MTVYLLDTHAVLWWWTDNPRLGEAGRTVIADDTNRICISAASIWEIGIKSHAGRLPEIPAFRDEYRQLIDANRFNLLTVDDRNALDAAYLPGAHRDPFDRLIAAQALSNDFTVVTRDREIAAFGCKVLW